MTGSKSFYGSAANKIDTKIHKLRTSVHHQLFEVASLIKSNYEANIAPFNRTTQDDFQIWALMVNAALQSRDLSQILSSDDVEKNVNKRTMVIMISALCNNPLRVIRKCRTEKEAWETLESRYSGKTIMNKLGSLTALYSIQYKRETSMIEHILTMKSHFAGLSAMTTNLDKGLNVAIFLFSLLELSKYARKRASVHTFHNSLATWSNATMLVIEESESLKNSSQSQSGTYSSASGRLAVSCTPTKFEERKRQVRCYICDGLGHIAKHSTATQRSRSKRRLDRPRRKRSDSTGLAEKSQSKVDTAVRTLLPIKNLSNRYDDDRTWGNAIVDSGASEHADSDLKCLKNVVQFSPLLVELSNGNTSTVTRTGQAKIDTGSSKIILTKDYLIITLKLSLISCSMLDEHRVTTTISGGVCKWRD